jgi:hypothetical protein
LRIFPELGITCGLSPEMVSERGTEDASGSDGVGDLLDPTEFSRRQRPGGSPWCRRKAAAKAYGEG